MSAGKTRRQGAGPAGWSGLLAGCLLLLAAPATGGLAARDSAAVPQPPFPLTFETEHIVLTVEADSLRVDGIYVMGCHGDRERTFALNYPYPRDERLGGARTVSFAHRLDDEPWQDGRWRELPRDRGALWTVPVVPGATLTIRTTYRQALRTDYARYIVTTTSAWGRPLRRAVFEIRLPAGVEPVSFSYPFVQCEAGLWRYEAEAFLPERDITVEWRATAGGR